MRAINSTPANLNLNQFQKKFFNNKQLLDLSQTTFYSSQDIENEDFQFQTKSALNFGQNSDRSEVKENARNQIFNSSSYFYINQNKRVIK